MDEQGIHRVRAPPPWFSGGIRGAWAHQIRLCGAFGSADPEAKQMQVSGAFGFTGPGAKQMHVSGVFNCALAQVG